MDILYGRNPVLEALRSGRGARKLVVAIGVEADARLEEIRSLAGARGLPIEETARRRLDDIAHTEHHQGVAGYFHRRPPVPLDELLRHAPAPVLLVALDSIQDPQNLGAIVRTAGAVGAAGVIISRHRTAGVTAAAAKAAAGATEHVPVVVVANLASALGRLRDAGVWVVGLAADGTTRYDQFDLTGPVALVIGGEGGGLRPLTRRSCDLLLSIPLQGRIASLNAGAAAAVVLYEAARQRDFRSPA